MRSKLEKTKNKSIKTSGKGPTISVLLIIFVYALCNSHYDVMMNSVIDTFNLQGVTQGLLISMMNMGVIFALVLTPLLQGNINKWIVLFFSALIQGIMFIITGTIPSFAVMTFIYILLGLGGGWTDSYSNSLIVDLHKETSSKYLGLLHGCYGIGAILSPLLIQWLLYNNSLQNTYMIIGTIVLVVVLISKWIFFSSKSHKIETVNKNDIKVSKDFIKQYFTNKRNILLVLSSVFVASFQAGLLSWIVRFMTLEYGSAIYGSITISLFWICTTISRFLLPQLNIGQLKIYGYGMLLSGILVVVALNSGSPLITTILVAMAGFTCGHSIPTLISLGTEHYEDSTSFPTSVILLSMAASRLVMPLIMGTMADMVSMFYAMLLPVGAALLAFIIYLYFNKVDGKINNKMANSGQ